MDSDGTVQVLVVSPEPARSESVANALEAAATAAHDRIEAETVTVEAALEGLAAVDADCVVGDATEAGPLLESIVIERPDLPVVLFADATRSADGSAPDSTMDGPVADVVRLPVGVFDSGEAPGGEGGAADEGSDAADQESGDGDAGGAAHDASDAGRDDAGACGQALLQGVEAALDPRDGTWYRSLLDATTDVIAVLDEGGRIEYVNGAVEPVLGYRPGELVGRSAFEFVHEDDREDAAALFARFTEEGPEGFPSATFRFRHADGHWAHVESKGRPPFGGDVIDGHVVCLQDITDRIDRQRELAQFETIVETAPVGLFVLDEDGVITWANDDYSETLGIPREELLGTSFLDLVDRGYYDESVPEVYLEKLRTLLSSANDVEEVAYPVETVRNDGERRVHDAHITLLPLSDGQFQGTVVAYRDVTKQQEYEAELERQNERLDRFASTVSHDLRNPLSVAKGRVQLARETGDLEHLEHVEDAHERMTSLVEGLLALARDDEDVGDCQSVDLREAAETAWQAIDDGAAALSVRGDGTVVADPGRLRQLLENLLRNSVEHGGDDVTVRVGALEGREGFYVEDDGRGIPPDEADRVFEHGYTSTEEGTGFGLGIVQTVADDHGWTVRLVAGEEGGARFEIGTGNETGDERVPDDGRTGGSDDGHATDRQDDERPADE